uniref:Ommochrome-binding protein-like n=1 Tax=Strongyloides venezuelensis TaxID=75913 RepID=A0A0K0EWH7_STRVS
MDKIIQLFWILASYSIIIESIDLNNLFENHLFYKNFDYTTVIEDYTIKGGTKLIAVKCSNLQRSVTNVRNNIQIFLNYIPYKEEDKKRKIMSNDGTYYWLVHRIENSDEEDIHCGLLIVNHDQYFIGYKITINNGDNVTISEGQSFNNLPHGNTYILNRNNELLSYSSINQTSEGDLLYTFNVDNTNHGLYQVSEAINIAKV